MNDKPTYKPTAKPAKATKPWLLPHQDGKRKVDVLRAPDWWISTPDEAEAFMRGLKGVEVFEIGRSAGNRPILAGAWGAREALPGRTSRSLSAAISGGSPAAFYGRGRRKRQCFVHLGAVHACEFEGSVAALHLLNIAVTGKDLRGRSWPRLAAAVRQLRLVVIPNMIYHCCGALPVVVEFPHGHVKAADFNQVLDIGLCVFEEMLTLGVAKGFIPDWPQDYVP